MCKVRALPAPHERDVRAIHWDGPGGSFRHWIRGRHERQSIFIVSRNIYYREANVFCYKKETRQ